MTENIGRAQRTPSMVDQLAEARARSVVRESAPPAAARCHPDRPAYRVGLCQHCYAGALRDRRRTATDIPTREIVRRTLSEREQEIASHIASGLTNKLIAHRLGISEQTVKNHVTACLKKTGTTNRAHLGALAARGGLVVRDVDVDTGHDLDGRILPADIWMLYFEAVETNLDRLRRDVNLLLVKVRAAKRLVFEPPKVRPPLTGDPQRIVPASLNRNRGIHCKRGHLFTEANTHITKRGGRHCRTCARDRARVEQAAARAALRREKAAAA